MSSRYRQHMHCGPGRCYEVLLPPKAQNSFLTGRYIKNDIIAIKVLTIKVKMSCSSVSYRAEVRVVPSGGADVDGSTITKLHCKPHAVVYRALRDGDHGASRTCNTYGLSVVPDTKYNTPCGANVTRAAVGSLNISPRHPMSRIGCQTGTLQ